MKNNLKSRYTGKIILAKNNINAIMEIKITTDLNFAFENLI